MTNQRNENFTAHFSNEISEDLKKFVIDEALFGSRYMFITRVTSTIQRGYCTHCQSNHMITSTMTLKHNEEWQCEKCKSFVRVKSSGRGRGKMFDKAYVIWYEKSKSNPKAIVATGYNISRDYRDDYKGVTDYYPVARYVFEPGKATMMYRNHYYSGCFNTRVMCFEEGWSFAKQPWTMIGKNSYTSNSLQSIESIDLAVKGTPFKYGEWEKFSDKNQDLIYFFSTFAKYPFIEYFSKMGMRKLVECMVEKGNYYKAINLRGKSMEKILGLTKKEINDWKASGIEMDTLVLFTYKWFRENEIPISWVTAANCDQLLAGTYYLEKLKYIQKWVPLEKIIRYITNQINKDTKRYYSLTSVVSTWKDYLEECIELNMDLTQDKVLLPNSLHAAHQKTTRSIKVKKDETINRKIASMQPQLKKYCFEYGDLMIRPAVSSIEMFDEGKSLDHCVGRYADRYAKGEIAIMFIRSKSVPDKSFYTVEIYRETNEIVQCRGLKNCNPTPEVEAFLETYKMAKLTKKAKNSKSTLAERQGVAV